MNNITGFLIRIIISAVILFALISKTDCIDIKTLGGTILTVSIISFFNALIRPGFSLFKIPLKNSLYLIFSILAVNIIISFILINILPGITVIFNSSLLGVLIFFVLLNATLNKFIEDR
ncbi:hypothetical protein LJC10_02570 [Selenomonadales bacterium OttesenSCG-928-I06]|nr:hypothetical protein [Selenomonadales bacterium OttesenSCG-928-I06]